MKFHKLRAEYVAVAGRPRWDETSINGTEIAAGNLYFMHQYIDSGEIWCKTYLRRTLSFPDVSMGHE